MRLPWQNTPLWASLVKHFWFRQTWLAFSVWIDKSLKNTKYLFKKIKKMCSMQITRFLSINILIMVLILNTQNFTNAGEGDKDNEHGAGVVLYQHKISELGIHRNEYLLLLSSRTKKNQIGPIWSFPKGRAKLEETNLLDVFRFIF